MTMLLTTHRSCDPRHCRVKADSATKQRLLWTALLLLCGFSVVEFAVSVSSHSLALLAEAGHLLSDGMALGVALLATVLARKPASERAPFGYGRLEILAALVQGLGLVAIALWVAWEAIERLQSPAVDILGIPMLITAIAGFAVSALNATLLHDHSHHDLNLRGAFLHMVADALSAVGVMLAALAVWAFQWNWADGVISLGVAVLIGFGAIPLIRDSLSILLEQTPAYRDLDELETFLLSQEGVLRVEKLRVWAIAPGHDNLNAYLVVNLLHGADRDRLLLQLQSALQEQFGFTDICLQLMAPVLTAPINLSQPPSLAALVVAPPSEDRL
ncbi:cation diffusion facilitator family transporter [Leptolyngbya sp. FACHB-16]|uniref:cation diffusion facilitator family transporter n=2 Tax=Leptolyngbya TaxID=47251 RepID=UPI00168783FE|nr:cation diffusion facilitator family transporter [Leptolyngbya sp. FACHB-16]MBD1912616.1 cation transporter [Leptolyngbya sp. FACHB-8]MBD2156786.1 cation transporter [Leptolyngbya sp. FACHB-16]